ncbi:MAG: DMT family transporter [Hyphomicrobiaceae bacterium]|nr:DMT family transporter [Hyphomicrobiaceae bacterium]
MSEVREPAAPANTATGAVAPRTIEAIAAMVVATFVFTLGDVAMRLAAGAVPTGQSVFLRSTTSVVLVAIAAHATGVLCTLQRGLVPWMAWRSVGDAGNSLLFQAALPRMMFADIMAVLQLTPLSLTAASALFLGATVGWRRWCAVGAGLIGTLMVIKPGSGTFNVWALLAIGSVLCGTLRDVATRRIDGGLSPLIILLLSQTLVALAGLGLSLFQTWVWPTPFELLLVMVAGAMTLLGHLAMIVSLRIGDIAAVAPFRYAGIVWAILIGILVWGEIPDAWSLTGIAILILAGLYTFHRERRVRAGPR